MISKGDYLKRNGNGGLKMLVSLLVSSSKATASNSGGIIKTCTSKNSLTV
jgi:hypothetical protein